MKRNMKPTSRALAALLLLAPGACSREAPDGAKPVVVLYYSADEAVAKPIIEAFEKETGIEVRALTDTEATKTTGLVTRLRTEQGRPRADVFWASEPLQLMQLDAEGIVRAARGDPSTPTPVSPDQPDSATLRPFALRARVLVFNTKLVSASEAPRTMAALTEARWRGHVVMARPEFGTTRTHMAALAQLWGEAGASAWRAALAENGVRVVDGNSAVVRAVAQGEAPLGLTDSDDVFAGQAQGWPVDSILIEHAKPGAPGAQGGVLLIPNAAAWVTRGPHPAEATRLIEFLLSERVERMLAESPARHIPARESLLLEFPERAVARTAIVNYAALARSAR